MFDSTTFTTDMISNPTLLATTIINAMETSDTLTTPISINDPNNGFVMQLFSGLCLFSTLAKKIDNANSFFYPQRARNAAQLYPHLSEFDFTQLMASPATLGFTFAMSRDWIIANAVSYDSNYNKIVLPATSYFDMSGVQYSMYYPIEILVNVNTGSISAFYDTTITNPLYTLSTNMLLNTQEYTKDGINYFQMSFNMFQFSMVSSQYTVGAEEGFNMNIPYNDNFYSVRVFYQNANLSYTELAYSLSSMNYDYTTPTAVISLLTDISSINVTIPQVYFTNNQITNTIRVDLYTSKGEVNYSLSMADVTSLTANFDTGSSKFAAPLDIMPTWSIYPNTLVVFGGSNPMTYDQIRSAVVNQGLYNRVAITNQELLEAGNKLGFTLTKVIDDLAQRMYYASNVLKDTNGIVVPTFTGSILLSGNNLAGNPSSILNFSDGYYTILPTTSFVIPNSGNVCTPNSNGEVAALASMSTNDLVTELNKGTYLRQPFHITLLTTPKSPNASVYNLMTPGMTSLSFISENAHSAAQMSVLTCSIINQNHGTGGYLFNLGVSRSLNISTDNASNYQIILTTSDVLGNSVYIPATYVSTANNLDVWQFVIATSYHIDSSDNLTVMMYNNNNILSPVDIPLNTVFNVLTCFNQSYNTSIPQDPTLNKLLPNSLNTTLTVMSQQSMTISLGTDITSSIYTGVNTTWGLTTYQTAPSNIYFTANNTIFQTDESNYIVAKLDPVTNAIDNVVLYNAGDTPSSTSDISIATTSNTAQPASGTTTSFNFVNTTGILVGMPVRGLNIPTGTTVISTTATSVVTSSVITGTIPTGTLIIFSNSKVLVRTNQAQTSPSESVQVASIANIFPGMTVYGFNIAKGTVVSSVNSSSNEITLSIMPTAAIANNTLLTIINNTAAGVIKISAGSIVTDINNNPISIQESSNQYRIPAILFDGRLFESTDPIDVETVSTLYSTIQSYASQIASIDSELIENSNVYYNPLRSMGNANFGTGNNVIMSLPLEFSFTVNVFVTPAVYNQQYLKVNMQNTIINIINAGIQNPIISVSDITDSIRTSLDTNAVSVEMGGINNNNNLRLVALEDTGVVPSVEYILVVNSDGTISRVPNITVNFIPSPITL